MEFEWDKKKEKINLQKHNVDFMLAIEVFSDPFAVETTRFVNNEERIQILGLIENCVISVVYIYRKNNIRIISARLASKKERKLYGQKVAT